MILFVGCNSTESGDALLESGDMHISEESKSSEQDYKKEKSSNISSDDFDKATETTIPTLEEMFYEITKTQRKCGTSGEIRALEYISQQMKSFGYDVTIQTFDVFESAMKNAYKDDVYFDFETNGQTPVAQGSNIIADLNYDKNKKTMIFSAHYDTTADSLGALDNGSGTAALMEAAKLISEYQTEYNIRIIFFSAEENGLYGSRYYVGNLSEEELPNIIGCFNFDVVGAKDCRKVLLQTYQQGSKKAVEGNWITKEYGRINGEFELMRGSSSDHAPFIKKGIPAVQLATVDPRDESFDKGLLKKEESTDSVSIQNLQKDANLIFEFMKEVDILGASD